MKSIFRIVKKKQKFQKTILVNKVVFGSKFPVPVGNRGFGWMFVIRANSHSCWQSSKRREKNIKLESRIVFQMKVKKRTTRAKNRSLEPRPGVASTNERNPSPCTKFHKLSQRYESKTLTKGVHSRTLSRSPHFPCR